MTACSRLQSLLAAVCEMTGKYDCLLPPTANAPSWHLKVARQDDIVTSVRHITQIRVVRIRATVSLALTFRTRSTWYRDPVYVQV